MKKLMSLIIVNLGICIFSVNAQEMDHSGHSMNTAQSKSVTHYEVSKDFQKQLDGVIQANLKLKEAFVASNADAVKSAAFEVKDALGKTNMHLLQGQAHMDWMNYLNTMNSQLESIGGTASIDEQRTHFAAFTDALYNSVKAFGINTGEVYYQFCPMALNSQGAYWLSDTREIRNPYMGKMMLTCGITKEIIK